VTLVAGSGLTLLVSAVTQNLQWRHEREGRVEQLRLQRREELAAFRRDAILNLQDAAVAMDGAAGALEGARTRQPWAEDLATANRAWREAIHPVLVWAARVNDPSLRQLAGELISADMAWTHAESPEAAPALGSASYEVLRRLNNRAAELLSALDTDHDGGAI
jgi:hypothetical protein